MAAYMTVSETQWKNVGFDPKALANIKAKGNIKVVWGPQNYWGFRIGDSEPQGKAKYTAKEGIVSVDQTFAELFEKHSGMKLEISKVTDSVVAEATGSSGVPKLKDATTVGTPSMGSSKVYKTFAITDDFNMSCRKSASSLSIRVEKFTPAAKAALLAWGFDFKATYASVHVSVDSPATAKKTLGSAFMAAYRGGKALIADPSKVIV